MMNFRPRYYQQNQQNQQQQHEYLMQYCESCFSICEPNDNDASSFVYQSWETRQLLVFKLLQEKAAAARSSSGDNTAAVRLVKQQQQQQ